jgi:hypothetical protein
MLYRCDRPMHEQPRSSEYGYLRELQLELSIGLRVTAGAAIVGVRADVDSSARSPQLSFSSASTLIATPRNSAMKQRTHSTFPRWRKDKFTNVLAEVPSNPRWREWPCWRADLRPGELHVRVGARCGRFLHMCGAKGELCCPGAGVTTCATGSTCASGTCM